MGQVTNQPAIELLGDAGRQGLAPCEVLLNPRRQGRSGAPVVPVAADNSQHTAAVDARTVTPITACGVFALVAMPTLIAMRLAIGRVSLAVPLALAIPWIGPCQRRAANQCKRRNSCNQRTRSGHGAFLVFLGAVEI
ncbi:hypothetical protein D3C81_1591110 [compost metagenome]